MRKNILITLVMVLLVIVIVLALNRDSTVNIAVIGNYSSRTSSGSIDTYRIINYIVEELNSEGKDYVIKQYNISDYQDYEKLKVEFDGDEIDLVIGPNSTSEAEPLFELLSSLDVPVFLTNVASDMYTDIDDNIFRINTNVSEQANKIATVIMEKNNKQPITIYYTEDNINYSSSFANVVVDNFAKVNIDVELIKVGSLENNDVQEMLRSEIKTEDVLIIAGPGKGGIITDIVCSTNTDTNIYLTAWSKSDATLEYMTDIPNEIYSIGFVAPKISDRYNNFVNNILVEEGWTKNVFTFAAYETMYFIDYVIDESKSLKVEDVKNLVYSLDVYQGYFYDFKFDSYGDGGKGFSLYKVVDNNYEIEIDSLDY